VLVAAGPDRRFSRAETDILSEYLNRNGRLLALIDAGTDTGLEELLHDWGVRLGSDTAVGMTLTVASATESANDGTYRITGVTATVLTVDLDDHLTTKEDDATATFVAGFTDFDAYRLVGVPYIDDSTNEQVTEVKPVSWENLRAYRSDGYDTEGTPEWICCANSRKDAEIFPEADTAYTLYLPYWRPLVTWTPGTSNVITLNIPDEYADDIIAFGARAFLVEDAPGHPDARGAERKFNEMLDEARGRLSPPQVHYADLSRGADRSWPVGGYIP
jgi:hypothetical protein